MCPVQSIYIHDLKNRYRYALGGSQKPTLFVIGVNPSKATDLFLDPTVKNVESFAQLLKFNSFLMLNLYPQRSTDPKGLHKRVQADHFKKNLDVIKKSIPASATIWAAWGDLIETREYLLQTLLEIENISQTKKWNWICYDIPTKKGHPRHPARKKHEDRFRKFNLSNYLKDTLSAHKN